jgi:molybdopterin-containing oxidoreductase family membrane subunit
MMLLMAVTWLLIKGTGIWGVNIPIGWGFAIINFVWWIGIGHAGTLISAILCLLKQKWRTGINRAAEAMTIFAVMCAGMFPAIHVGRIWMLWMVFPIPWYESIWPNFKSPLLWDVFAVSTYFTVSLLFWYMGLVPDLATLRDRAALQLIKNPNGPVLLPFVPIRVAKIRAVVYGLLSMGWRFSSRHWHHYEKAYLVLAGVSTPLVLSVHSIVSFDFATSVVPGWHTTIFPPYFVAGAIFGGFAMVLMLMIPARELFPNMKELLTLRHLENMAKIIVVTGLMVSFAYAMEFIIAAYSGSQYEQYVFFHTRASPESPYFWAYCIMIFCNVVSPQFFWIRWCRTTPWFIWIIAGFVTVGMWFERFVIIVLSLHRAFVPSEWGMFYPTPVDILCFVGSCGVFLTLFLLFLRFLPVFAIAEVKNVTPKASPHWRGYHHGHAAALHGGGGTQTQGPGGHGGMHSPGVEPLGGAKGGQA